MFKHILIATDGSPASEHAAQLAVNLARIHGAKLLAVYVIDPYPFLAIGESNPLGFETYMSAAQAHAAQAHAKVAQLCSQGASLVSMQARMVENVAAASGIVQTAKDEGVDLIVVGSHGRSGIARLMLGSVASKVVAESPLPVLVAR
ncbi:Nucleotide-binding universal stress protein, UspA family [Polaromonas sp. OV174]|uniref:universal stress protein n=1 Tax=Polaromonas sp. OV174 TaxID=1855300 RepID=UPI0008F0AB98|nr:universal stress protein [Polaromonas sp. OV174]SFB94730.1 Nucleotide-binding universal stress protein, UspA family [Polaromonas sp. OV174]